MNGANPILSSIYGTNGAEKVASADGQPVTLSDLALALVTDENDEKPDLEKLAGAHKEMLDRLVEFDVAGRAIAHQEFGDMEKAASEGDEDALAALEAFFADEVPNERGQIKAAIQAELARRANK